MNIYIDEISLKNFFNFKEGTFKFIYNKGNNWCNIISGNNGSGKSVLSVESIFFNLFGKSIRSNKLEDIVKIGERESTVIIKYFIKFNDYEDMLISITRSIKLPNSSSVDIKILDNNTKDDRQIEKIKSLEEITKVSNINSEIENIFKITPKDFIKNFIHAPINRNLINVEDCLKDPKIFENIELLFEIGNLAKKKIDEISFKRNHLINQLNNINQIIDKIETGKFNNISDVSELLNKIEKTIKTIEDLIKKNNNAKNKLDVSLIDIKSNISSINNTINDIKYKINNIKNLDECPTCVRKLNLEDKDKILKQLNTQMMQLQDKKNKDEEIYKKIYDKFIKIKNNISELNNKIINILKLKADCELFLKNFHQIEEYKKIVSNTNEEIKILSTEEEDYRELYSIFNKKSKYIMDIYNNKINNFLNTYIRIYKNLINNEDSLNFNIYDNKLTVLLNGIPYNLLSTSQKKKIELAYLVTVLYMSINNIRNNYPLNIIILDEYFDNFDVYNTNMILNNLLKFKFDVQTIITTNFIMDDNINILGQNTNNIIL